MKAFLFCLALPGLAVPARADDCAAPTQLAAVDLLPGNATGSRFLVPVSVNSSPRELMLDTGGGFTSLTPDAADALGLARQRSNQRLLDMTGHASRDYVQIDTLGIDGLALEAQGAKATHLWITPMPGLGEANIGAAFDGILAADLMTRYDVDIDFPARRMQFFSQDHCAGDVVKPPASVVAVVPFLMQRPDMIMPGVRARLSSSGGDTHISVPVMLDGRHFLAVIDTGAIDSTISARAAREAFGIDADSPGSRPLGMIDSDPAHRLFVRVFSRLVFEGVSVINPHLVVIPDLVGSKDPDNRTIAGSRIHRIDDDIAPSVTIGMDVLKHLNLYIAFGERKLYISIADAPLAAASAAKPSAPQ